MADSGAAGGGAAGGSDCGNVQSPQRMALFRVCYLASFDVCAGFSADCQYHGRLPAVPAEAGGHFAGFRVLAGHGHYQLCGHLFPHPALHPGGRDAGEGHVLPDYGVLPLVADRADCPGDSGRGGADRADVLESSPPGNGCITARRWCCWR